jgi:hypothetical protein
MVAHIYNPSYFGDRGRRIMSPRPAQTKLERPNPKNKWVKEKDSMSSR